MNTIYSGVLVPGGFGQRGIEGKIRACKWARETKKPYLGICLGLQVAVIEFARNVLKMEHANSTEIDPETKHPLVIDMPEHHTGKIFHSNCVKIFILNCCSQANLVERCDLEIAKLFLKATV